LSIKDPIGESLTTYRRVINQIDEELERVLPQLQKLIDNKLAED